MSPRCPHASTIHSQSAFDCPITVLAFTALSVDTRTNCSAPNSTATSATVRVTRALLRTASERVRLHQRHVLVGRGVEHHPGVVLLEDLAHLRRVARVGEHGGRVESALVHELALDLEEPGFAVVDEDEARRADARQLAAELGADRLRLPR